MDYENVSVDDEDFEEVSLCSELYEPVVNIILLKTKLFAVLCYNSACSRDALRLVDIKNLVNLIEWVISFNNILKLGLLLLKEDFHF